MLKTVKLLCLPLAITALMLAGCSDSPSTTGSPTSPSLALTLNGIAAADVQSATLYVYVNQFSGHEVQVHRATADWDEMTVTWGNFGGAFDGAVEGSFPSDATGWKTADITGLVQAWLGGTSDNFGLLLKQGVDLVPRTHLASREDAAANGPMLEICYTTAAGPNCIQIPAIADASIFENYPNDNTGAVPELFIGWYSIETLEKQALIKFDLPVEPEPAAIGDFVWYDTNEDGIQDEGEVGIEGVVVRLFDCAGQLLATTATDANGFYLFSNLMPGDYNIGFEPPLGFVISPQDQGMDDALDSDADPTTGLTVCTTLESGETDLTWDAGMYLPPPQIGCTLTIGYWKNHAGFGPQDDNLSQFLPIWLGDEGGDKSIFVDDVQIAYDILVRKTYGVSSNGITKLYAQMLASKLNIANGATPDDVAETIEDADAFLADHDWTDWDSLSKRDKKMVLGWMTTFDQYNNGLIGPGHCDHFQYQYGEE